MVLHRLHLSSDQADRYLMGPSRTDALEFNLEPSVSCSQGEIMLVRLESAAIPIGRYVVHSGNNVLKVSGNFGDSTVTLPAQVYADGAALVSALNSAMATAGLASLSATYSESTHKITFVNGYTFNVTLLAHASGSTISRVIGYGLAAFVLPASQSVILPAMVDLAGARSILVAVESFELDTLDSLASTGSSSTNVLAAIPVSVPWGSVQTYQDSSAVLVPSRRKNLSSVILQILDEDQLPYDLNGLTWSCVLSVDVV